MGKQFGSQLPDEHDNPPPEGVRVYTPDEYDQDHIFDRMSCLLDSVNRAAQNLLVQADPVRGRATELFGQFTKPMPSQHRAPLAPE